MTTPNVGLDEIAENQASKYLTHNAALRDIDVLLQAIVEDKDLTTPPALVDGKLYIVATSATGDWLGQDNKLAYAVSSAWEFITPKTDWNVYVRDETALYRFNGSTWDLDAAGDVTGPGTSTDNAWVRFDGTTGKQLQNGTWAEDDSGNVIAGGNLDMDDNTLTKPAIKDYAEETNNLGNMTATVDIDYENGNFQYGVLADNVTFTISNPPTSGKVGSLTLELQQDATGSRTVTWPASVQFVGGTAPTLSTGANELDVFVLYTRDGGTSYRLGVVGLDFS